MYHALYPPTLRCGSGLNAVTRAIDVAVFMGFGKITILGADCALKILKPMPEGIVANTPEHLQWLRESVIMHANGDHALASGATSLTVGGIIDGRHWETKPDMMITANFLVTMKRHYGKQLEIIGDTLPNALMHKPQKFLDRLPNLFHPDGTPIRFCTCHVGPKAHLPA
jgi:hypothetical protein